MGGRPDNRDRQSLSDCIAHTAERLKEVNAGNPRFEAELMLADALEKPRVFLYTNHDYIPTSHEMLRFQNLVERRLAFEPLQYVLGTSQFRDLMLRVRPGVLIPRSETEGLVDIAWKALERQRRAWERGERRSSQAPLPEGVPSTANPLVVDVGVGSGAILLSLIYEDLQRQKSCARQQEKDSTKLPQSAIETPWFNSLGIDISPTCLSCIADNAAHNRVPAPGLIQSDFLSALSSDAAVVGIVSNPPYVSSSEMAELPVEIDEYEPHEALFGGEDGMMAIRMLLDQSRPFIKRGAFFCFEMGGRQESLVRAELKQRDLLEITEIFPDLAGRSRVVLIEPETGD